PGTDDQRNTDDNHRSRWLLAEWQEQPLVPGGHEFHGSGAERIERQQDYEADGEGKAEAAGPQAVREPVHVEMAEEIAEVGGEAADDERGEIEPSRTIAP